MVIRVFSIEEDLGYDGRTFLGVFSTLIEAQVEAGRAAQKPVTWRQPEPTRWIGQTGSQYDAEYIIREWRV